MNERLEQMMLKAAEDMPHAYYVPHQYWEKFAELIIAECASLIIKNAPVVNCKEDFHYGYVADGYMESADLIKEHFGVCE